MSPGETLVEWVRIRRKVFSPFEVEKARPMYGPKRMAVMCARMRVSACFFTLNMKMNREFCGVEKRESASGERNQ